MTDRSSTLADASYAFERDTELIAARPGQWQCSLSTHWNIGENPNGGYAAAPVLRAMRDLAQAPDPVSVTTHFLKVAMPGRDADVSATLRKRGRSLVATEGSLSQDGVDRILSIAAFGEVERLGRSRLHDPPPTLPGPDDCMPRHGLEVGVDVPITSRVDVRLDPETSIASSSTTAEIRGWVRFADERPPDTLSLPLLADAFPPSAYVYLEPVGWIPTVELTVHVLRRPVDGWLRARFRCHDIVGDRMVETGTLWDDSGQVVATCRQIGQILRPPSTIT